MCSLFVCLGAPDDQQPLETELSRISDRNSGANINVNTNTTTTKLIANVNANDDANDIDRSFSNNIYQEAS
eukprot:Awhi_evm1s15800